jgi:hypothetical protein
MEGQGCRRDAEMLTDFAGGETVRALLDQQAKDCQAGFLRDSCKERDGGFCFHISKIMEMTDIDKRFVWQFREQSRVTPRKARATATAG